MIPYGKRKNGDKLHSHDKCGICGSTNDSVQKNRARDEGKKEITRQLKENDMHGITVEYDGKWPNLCNGNLTLTIEGKKWKFPKGCLDSGGSISFDKDWSETITQGPWRIDEWPEGFPELWKPAAREAVNDKIDRGCCGGCV